MSTSRRLFVAVRPPPTIAEEIERILQPATWSDLRWSNPADLHVTLHFLGQAEVDPVVNALDDVLAEPAPAPIEVELGPDLIELGSAVAIRATGLDDLAERAGRAVEGLGQPPRHPGFVGHLTVGRWRRGRRRPALLDRPVTASFVAGEVELLASDGLTQAGDGSYDTVRTWPLGPTPAGKPTPEHR